jgi:hypothetical protein
MKSLKAHYVAEYTLVVAVILLSVAGFWNIYLGADATPTPYQNLHVITSFTWLFLLLYQLWLIDKKNFLNHRKIGLSIAFIGPLLVATTTLLSVHSAHKGLVSGRGDFLIVQNVTVTLELGLLILLGFVVKKKRRLHAAFLLRTTILFMGIALFFTLISFVPQFKIEGPETFYRFGTASTTAQYICSTIALAFFLKDIRNGWPFIVAGSFFLLNDLINDQLVKYDLMRIKGIKLVQSKQLLFYRIRARAALYRSVP